jgi:hypothetical protein
MKQNKQQPSPRASIRSPWPTAAHPLNLLSDRRIETYLLRGFYGKDAQEKARIKAAEKELAKIRRKLSRGAREAVAVAKMTPIQITPDLY